MACYNNKVKCSTSGSNIFSFVTCAVLWLITGIYVRIAWEPIVNIYFKVGVGNPRYDMPYSIVLQFLCQSRFYHLSIFDVVASPFAN